MGRGDYYYQAYIETQDFDNDFRVMLAKKCDEDLIGVCDAQGSVAPYEPGVIVAHTFRLSRPQWKALVQGVLEWANRENIRTDSEEKLAGKLEATKYHLEDLRALVFKKEPT